MKIFCTFPTINISKLNFWLLICIAKSFIWTTLKVIFSNSRFSNSCISTKYCSSSSSSSPLLSLVQVPAKLAINLSIHTQHTYDNGVDRTGDRVFRKYSFLHEEREEEKKIFNPQTMLHLEYSLRTEKKTPQHKSTYTINTWHCNRGKHIQLWQAAIRSSAMRRRSQTCSP